MVRSRKCLVRWARNSFPIIIREIFKMMNPMNSKRNFNFVPTLWTTVRRKHNPMIPTIISAWQSQSSFFCNTDLIHLFSSFVHTSKQSPFSNLVFPGSMLPLLIFPFLDCSVMSYHQRDEIRWNKKGYFERFDGKKYWRKLCVIEGCMKRAKVLNWCKRVRISRLLKVNETELCLPH